MKSKMRWSICAMLFFATTINYLDRQVFGLLKPLLEKQFDWSETEYSYLVIVFQGCYAAGLLSMGGIIDRVGTKVGYAVCMSIWTLASIAHAFVGSTVSFAVVRGVLGFGESGNFPAAVKAVAEWFPKSERALAVGILTAGTSIGAIVAPATVPWLAATFGWQGAFIITALTGAAWLVMWLLFYRQPQMHRAVSPDELAYITQDDYTDETAGERTSWISLLGARQTWSFAIGKFLTDPIWYFMLFWLPSYFADRFKLDLSHLGLPLMAVYLATSVGSISGGWLSSMLIKRGWRVQAARQAAMFVMALLVVPLIFSSSVHDMWAIVGLLALAAAAHQGWSANLFTTASDNFSKAEVASVTGIGGMAGSVGGMLFPIVIGLVLDHFKRLGAIEAGYSLLFIVCGCAYLTAWLVMQLLGASKPSSRAVMTPAVA